MSAIEGMQRNSYLMLVGIVFSVKLILIIIVGKVPVSATKQLRYPSEILLRIPLGVVIGISIVGIVFLVRSLHAEQEYFADVSENRFWPDDFVVGAFIAGIASALVFPLPRTNGFLVLTTVFAILNVLLCGALIEIVAGAIAMMSELRSQPSEHYGGPKEIMGRLASFRVIFCGMAAMILSSGMIVAVLLMRSAFVRSLFGRVCWNCGYTRNDASDNCPECGAPNNK